MHKATTRRLRRILRDANVPRSDEFCCFFPLSRPGCLAISTPWTMSKRQFRMFDNVADCLEKRLARTLVACNYY